MAAAAFKTASEDPPSTVQCRHHSHGMYEMCDKIDIKKCINSFQTDCKELLFSNSKIPEIEVDVDDPEWPLIFHRNYVSKHVPVVIKNGCKHFEATRKWSIDYFRKHLAKKKVTVAVTPNGYADGILNWKNPEDNSEEELFVLPDEQQMLFKEFLDNMRNPKKNFICYIQRQNSNLFEDFQELTCDIEPEIHWASKAFDKKPDAVNFWMGDSRAVTSMHKDFYENIFCVIDGYKDFILIPPSDLPNITYRQYGMARFANVTPYGYEIEICPDEDGESQTVPWIANDPLQNDPENFPLFSNANIHQLRLHKYDLLYIPNMWFHHVRQSQACIAVNYWYDMEFDVKFCYYNLLESLSAVM